MLNRTKNWGVLSYEQYFPKTNSIKNTTWVIYQSQLFICDNPFFFLLLTIFKDLGLFPERL